MIFRISDNYEICYNDYKSEGLRVTILARSGGGKSNLAALFAEQALDQGLQLCIMEPIEEWYTLRTIYDHVVWVGDGGDIPLLPSLPQQYAKILQDGVSMILSISTGDEYVDKRFAADFLWSLYVDWKKIRRPMFLIVEEADTYAPQMWGREDRLSLSRMALLAKRGRKLGINMITLSQRPADIHKSVISQSNLLFIGGFKTSQDLTAVRELSKMLHLPLPTEEVAQLEPGEFFVVSKGEVSRIRANIRRTPHGGSTPELQPIRADIGRSLEAVRETLQRELDRLKEEQDMIVKLRKENEMLRAQIQEYEEQLRTMKIVKEIPIEIKASTSTATVSMVETFTQPTTPQIPAIVYKSPYPQTMQIYMYLRQNPGPRTVKEIATATGIGYLTVRRILKYLRKKGVVRTRLSHYLGKQVIRQAYLQDNP